MKKVIELIFKDEYIDSRVISCADDALTDIKHWERIYALHHHAGKYWYNIVRINGDERIPISKVDLLKMQEYIGNRPVRSYASVTV